MPVSIKLDDRGGRARGQAGQPIDAFVERVLQGCIDADIEFRDGIQFRMPPGAPILISTDIDRLLHCDLDSQSP